MERGAGPSRTGSTESSFVDSSADDFMVIREKNGAFSAFGHADTLRDGSSREQGGRDNVPLFRPPARL